MKNPLLSFEAFVFSRNKKCVTHTMRATQKNTARFVATQNLSLALQRNGIEPVFLPEIKTHAKLKDKLNFV